MPYNPLNNIDHEMVRQWYSNPNIKFKMIKYLKNRELAMLVPKHWPEQQNRSVRNIRCHNFGVKTNGDKIGLDYVYEVTGFFKHNTSYNFYYSLAEYETGLPHNSPRLSDRNNSEWNMNHYKQMVAYDWLLDVDAPSFQDIEYAYKSAKEIKTLFDELNVPYYLRFSGQGFHFIIPYRFLPQNLSFDFENQNNIYKFLHKCAKKMYDEYSELVDLNIYDTRRVTKIPYTIALYDNEMLVCHPFETAQEFDEFKKEKCVIWPSLYKLRPQNYPNVLYKKETLFNPEGNMKKFYEMFGVENAKMKRGDADG